ncbi:spore coat U domain-containing protein [Sphingomonas sp. MMS24-J13]|uniref:Csu type fimbrial protein n=1 Tax=Sphingomonas sp. MMS24-J13 TaxID=3238686 RepID=UPI00384C0572
MTKHTRRQAHPRAMMIALIGVSFTGAMSVASPADAATTTTTFPVSATVQAACSMSASNIAFGTYTGATLTATGSLSVTCTNSTSFTVGLSAGTGNGATTTTRNMMGPGAATLSYQMFRDAGYSANWGNTIGTDTYPGVGTGSGQILTIYGRVPAGQGSTPGAYSDTITATLTY